MHLFTEQKQTITALFISLIFVYNYKYTTHA